MTKGERFSGMSLRSAVSAVSASSPRLLLMPGSISNRTLLQPRSLADALKMLRDEGPLVPMAGCTDLYVSLNFGTLKDTRFLNLWGLDGLRTIEVRGDVLSIGALATHTDLIRSPLVRRRMPMLAAAAREVGGVQIQNRGTLGGNVANASPAGDTLPVLAAADAVVVLAERGRDAPRAVHRLLHRLPAVGPAPGRADRRLRDPRDPAAASGSARSGTRAAQAISKVVMAGVAPSTVGPDGGAPRIALGSVAPTVVRATRTEAALAGGASLEDAQRTLLDEIAPIDDIRSTAEYRRRVAVNLLARFWTDAHRG